MAIPIGATSRTVSSLTSLHADTRLANISLNKAASRMSLAFVITRILPSGEILALYDPAEGHTIATLSQIMKREQRLSGEAQICSARCSRARDSVMGEFVQGHPRRIGESIAIAHAAPGSADRRLGPLLGLRE